MKRVLAIDPITKGFGFALFDGPEMLVDWGLKGTSRLREPKERWCLRQIAELIEFHQPDRVIVEDCHDGRSRRRRPARRLVADIARVANERGIPVRMISKTRLRRAFADADTCTKYKIALAIATRFPELASRLPPVRKPWMSEDTRMGIFEAAALALAFYIRRQARTQSHQLCVLGLTGRRDHPADHKAHVES